MMGDKGIRLSEADIQQIRLDVFYLDYIACPIKGEVLDERSDPFLKLERMAFIYRVSQPEKTPLGKHQFKLTDLGDAYLAKHKPLFE